MKIIGRLLSVAAALLVCSAMLSCSVRSGVLIRSEKAHVVAQTLRECPAWTQVAESDVRQRQHITDVYLVAAQYDTATIRDALVLYLDRYPVWSTQRFEGGEKSFALLRVVFRVPPLYTVKSEPMRFGLLGNPVQSEGVNLLWPYSMDASGHLLLTGVDLGVHTGPDYDPLRDFDQMASRLERRFPVSR